MSGGAVTLVAIVCGVVGYLVGNMYTESHGGLTGARSGTIAAITALVAGILYISMSVLFMLPYSDILGAAIVAGIVILVLAALNILKMRRAKAR